MTSGSRVFKTSRLVSRTDFSPFPFSWEFGFIGFSFKEDKTGNLLLSPPVVPLWLCLRLWGEACSRLKGLMEPSGLGFQHLILVLICSLEEWVRNKNTPGWRRKAKIGTILELQTFSLSLKPLPFYLGQKFSRTLLPSGVDCNVRCSRLVRSLTVSRLFKGSQPQRYKPRSPLFSLNYSFSAPLQVTLKPWRPGCLFLRENWFNLPCVYYELEVGSAKRSWGTRGWNINRSGETEIELLSPLLRPNHFF